MPWCPNCRNEYQEGVTVCADCGAALVDELPAAEEEKSVLAYIETEELAQKLIDYLGYSNVDAEAEFIDEKNSYEIRVAAEKLEEAQKAFRGFYKVESRNEASEAAEELKAALDKFKAAANLGDDDEINAEMIDSIPDDQLSPEEKEMLRSALVSKEVYKPTEVYVKKSDESKDMFSTAITFLVFAVALLIFLILNAMKIMTVFSSVPSLIVIGALAIGCCLVGINAIHRSQRAEAASVEEDKITAKVNEWLDQNITADFFTPVDADSEGQSDEIIYLRRTEAVKNALMEQFPGLEDNYADSLVEDFYDRFFASSKAETAEAEADDNAAETAGTDAADNETAGSTAPATETEAAEQPSEDQIK